MVDHCSIRDVPNKNPAYIENHETPTLLFWAVSGDPKCKSLRKLVGKVFCTVENNKYVYHCQIVFNHLAFNRDTMQEQKTLIAHLILSLMGWSVLLIRTEKIALLATLFLKVKGHKSSESWPPSQLRHIQC